MTLERITKCWECRSTGLFLVVGAACGITQQAGPALRTPSPLRADRVADTYAIYSKLLPGNEIEWGDAPRKFWLLEDTTSGLPLDQPCATSGAMNPHKAVQPPPERQSEFSEVLADYDNGCHERYKLDASYFQLKLPVRPLDEAGRKQYVNQVSGYLPPKDNIMQAPPTPQDFKGAAGMHQFTAVYFNQAHTLAMTEIGMYCGGLCGNWRWVVLEQKNGEWRSLPWVRMSAIS